MENGKWKMENGIRKMENGFNKSSIHPFIQSYIFVFTCIFFLSSSIIQPQSIDSLISEALRNNPQLKALQFRVEAIEYRSQSANSLPPPNLGIEFTQVPVKEINVWDKAISNSLSLSQMFPLGGKVSAMTEVEKKSIGVSVDDYSIYKLKLIADLKMSYYKLWLNERKIDIQQESIRLLNELINSIAVLYQVNRISQADVLAIQSEIASNKAQLIILDNQSKAEAYRINKLLGRDLNSKSIITEKNMRIDTSHVAQEILEEKLLGNPSLQKMNSMIEMNRAMITANNRELIPDLMIQGMIMRMPQGMLLTSKTDLNMLHEEPGKTEYMYSLMASINLPFAPWSVNKYKAKEQELFSGIKAIQSERNDMQREMSSQLREALVKLNTSKELMKLYDETVIPIYRQSIDAQVSAYQSNRTGINTVIDSYRMLLMQEMNNYMAQADYQMALAEIEMMTGALHEN